MNTTVVDITVVDITVVDIAVVDISVVDITVVGGDWPGCAALSTSRTVPSLRLEM